MHTSLLPFFAVVRATGDDRASFLHGQLSNHIEALAEGEACYATYNTPKGRVIANMIVANTGGELLLVLAATSPKPWSNACACSCCAPSVV